MHIRPLGTYKEPCYPTGTILDEHPELLRLVPKRWRGNPVVLAALTGVCALLSGCRYDASAAPPKVAPIFLHGHGRGTFGCDVVNPPVFLSEDEAREVIVQEAKRAGATFAPDVQTLRSVPLPVTAEYGFREDVTENHGTLERTPRKRTQRLPLRLDGTDREHRVAYEFVSAADFREWRVKDESRLRMSTVSHYDMLGTAGAVRNGIREAGEPGAYAVFYEPCAGWVDVQKKLNHWPPYGKKGVDWRAERAGMQAKAKQIARDELRKQVQDFIKWLKAEGVI
jgi:hypothetical protein